MSKMSGAQFDKAFATHMVTDHKKDITPGCGARLE
jgi:predicted outer membrane protein